MAFIDAHAHIYPEKIASRAVQSVSDFYTLGKFGAGDSTSLLKETAESPITNFIVHSVAIKPSNVQTINTFIASECQTHPEFIGFAAMHHDYEEMEAEVNRAIELGLHGFKIHPDTQKVDIDDPRLMNFYEIIAGRMPIVIHTGDYRYDYSHPRRLKKVLKAFPDLVVDATHLGGWSIFDRGYDILQDENCFVDTSSSSFWVGPRHLKELINLYGTDRVMFGSDYPLFDPGHEAQIIMDLGFSDDVIEKITWKNAERFAGVKIG